MNAKEFNELVAPKVNCKYGAPMGRSNVNNINANQDIPKVTNRRIYLDSGGYDKGGAYWGLGEPLYVTYSKCGNIITYHR